MNRCDRCGATAKETWERKGVQLLFCGHHANEHRGGLRAQGWTNTEVAQ
ncbi:hypothetical protein [Mycobacterium phage WXIN]|nr:hypothetical protein [Mycobacterium phage WXIN]